MFLEPPKWLSEDAIEQWHEVIEELDAAPSDAHPIARYCDQRARYNHLAVKVEQEGHYSTKVSSNGAEYQEVHPAVRILQTLDTQLARFETAFGLTPLARTKLGKVNSDKPESIARRPRD